MDCKTDIYIIVNPISGSFTNTIYANIVNTIKSYLTQYTLIDISSVIATDTTLPIMDDMSDNSEPHIETIVTLSIKETPYRLIEFKTSHQNHALQVFSQISLKDTLLIIIVGGDGTIHEVVNGLYTNCGISIEMFPMMAICPLGSGNHLAKLIGTETINDFYNALSIYSKSPYHATHRSIIPNVITDGLNRSVLSINTIIAGMPATVNDVASKVAGYLPNILSSLKYEIGTVLGIFSREYFGIETVNDQMTDELECDGVDVVGLFVQVTPSCGNNFIIDKRINGNETKLSYAYIKDNYTFRIMVEFTKERVGYESTELVRRYDSDSELVLKLNLKSTAIDSTLNLKPKLTIDGQSERFEFPATIKKSEHLLTFVSNI